MTSHAPLTIAMLGIGSSPHIVRLARDLIARGHGVHILSEDRHGPFESDIPVHVYPWRLGIAAKAKFVRKLLQNVRPDVLHSHYLNIGGFVGVATAFHPHVMHAWGSDVFLAPHYSKLQHYKTRVALRSADWVVSPSSAMKLRMDEIAPKLKHNEVLAWGIDTLHFSRRPAEVVDAFRLKYGLGSGPFIFSARALHPLYNQDVLLRAWPAVLSHFPGAKLGISRYSADPVFEANLSNEVARLNIADSVVWLEPLSYAELPAAYSACSAMVSIPSSDAPAITVMEAMACEKPVVVSKLPALHELVLEGVNGFMVEVRDPNAVAAGVMRALRLPDVKLLEMGGTNRAKIQSTAEREKSISRLEDIYRIASRTKGFGVMASVMNVVLGSR